MRKFQFNYRTAPVLFLLLCLLGFGLLIPWLGLYWDDWPVILMTRLQGARGFWNFYQYDRPFSAWTYILTAPILGSRPLPWHILTLLLRWLTVLGMWWSLRGIWPRHVREITWMAVLFAIYPSFIQQPIAVAFSQHWITYALYFLSIGCMIQAIRSPRWFWPLTALSILTCALQLFTMEYFIGLELLRPAFLWIIFNENQPSPRQRFTQVLKGWLPYLAVMIIFIIWRAFFLKLAGEDPNRMDLLYNLVSQPVYTLQTLLQLAAQDITNILAGAWGKTVDPTSIDLTSAFFLFTVTIALVGAGLTAFFLLRLPSFDTSNPLETRHWVKQAMLLGLAGIVLGFLPVWATQRQAIDGLYGSRFTLASIFGACILFVAVLEWFTPRLLPKVLFLSILVGLAIAFQIKNTNDYRWSWTIQRRFYWQLAWRAPYIKPDTPIISDGELFSFVGPYSTTTALNLLYPQPSASDKMAYWFFSMGRGLFRQIPQLLNGMKLKSTFRTFSFAGSSRDSLVIYYNPTEGRCMWVLSPADKDLPDLPELSQSVLPISNLSRIEQTSPESGFPPSTVFGSELEHTWCYYFEKADLARQFGDWQGIAKLGDEASQKGFETSHYRERLPFIEAYAHLGDWSKAQEWTLALSPRGANVPLVCDLWARLDTATPDSATKDASLQQIFQTFQCSASP
jgi:hypothetical protein